MQLVRFRDAGLSGDEIERLADILRRGGIGVVPSDTVYGISALASHEGALRRLARLKERPLMKPFPVQVSGMEDANRLALADGRLARALAEEFWPGPLTMVLERRREATLPFQGETLGIRVPDSPICLALIEKAGLLVLPSANLEGEPAPAAFDEISGAVLGAVDFAIDAGSCHIGVESTVVDARDPYEVLRVGAIPEAEIARVARESGRGNLT